MRQFCGNAWRRDAHSGAPSVSTTLSCVYGVGITRLWSIQACLQHICVIFCHKKTPLAPIDLNESISWVYRYNRACGYLCGQGGSKLISLHLSLLDFHCHYLSPQLLARQAPAPYGTAGATLRVSVIQVGVYLVLEQWHAFIRHSVQLR